MKTRILIRIRIRTRMKTRIRIEMGQLENRIKCLLGQKEKNKMKIGREWKIEIGREWRIEIGRK